MHLQNSCEFELDRMNYNNKNKIGQVFSPTFNENCFGMEKNVRQDI